MSKSIDADATEEEWAEFLAEVEKEILDPKPKPEEPPFIPMGGVYPWFPFIPWPGDDE